MSNQNTNSTDIPMTILKRINTMILIKTIETILIIIIIIIQNQKKKNDAINASIQILIDVDGIVELYT